MIRTLPLAVALLAVTLCSVAEARPVVCKKATIVQALEAAGKSTGAGINQVRCGDVTSDGARDAVFTVFSGGTAGPTHFGVLQGASDTAGEGGLVFFRDGYKVTVARVNARRFDVQQPHYRKSDANCCPSSYRHRPYRWNGETFRAGKVRRTRKPQQRFFD